MIIEALKYAFHYVSCPEYVRKLGLLSDLVGIESRFSRCKKQWQPHLDNSKQTILDTALAMKKRDRVLVLGAGSLHDLPLRELSGLFAEVHLVDIFFLQGTINEIKGYPNVDFHEVDVTGVLREAVGVVSKLGIDGLAELRMLSKSVSKHFLDDEFDLVISLNLLSQLPHGIKKLCEELKIESLVLNDFYASLILNHLVYLRTFALRGARVLLISDTEKMVYDAARELKACESSLEGLDETIFMGWEAAADWVWDLAPLGELEKDYSLKLQVEAYRL